MWPAANCSRRTFTAAQDPAHRIATRVYSGICLATTSSSATCCAGRTAASLPDSIRNSRSSTLPSFRADPARHGCRSETVIACNFSKKVILIGGTEYAGEIKKSVFTILNFLLPPKGVMPMHCSANVGEADDTAIFFGLSGTGKTTLSADPARTLIGDDEHGWSDTGVFNFEGGCYAKTINLSPEAEPEIYGRRRAASARSWKTW